ncbi:MAG: hypothetical protein HY696_03110 [Deltaproteobacteria bacterium]|nr:hypothetical protein [Deltaproteobacteria bacterium]
MHFPALAAPPPPIRPNFSMEYVVTVPTDPYSPIGVETRLQGGNEIQHVVWNFGDQVPEALTASGEIVPQGPGAWRWTPARIDGTVRYQIAPNHRRNVKGFDSYRAATWLLTRTSQLFPRKRYLSAHPIRGMSRVTFQLPPDWQVVSAMPALAARRFDALPRGSSIAAPYGWLLMGQLDVVQLTIADVAVTLATPKEPTFDLTPLRETLVRALPRYQRLFGRLPPTLLVIAGPEPMWHGGLSGEDSLYVSQHLPLVSADYTPTLLHELFHVLQGFRKSSVRADWVVEGLAEYYSLHFARALHMITRAEFAKGVAKFDRQATWRANFSTSTDQRVLYNAAPLLLFYFDQLIREHSADQKSLRDVVHAVATADEISTVGFKQALAKVLPALDWDRLFQRHVFGGERPEYEKYLERLKQPQAR